MKKTKRVLFIAFATLLMSTLAVSTVTLAWINWQKDVDSVQLDSGTLDVTLNSSSALKYTYSTYSPSTDLIDYDTEGTIVKHDISTEGTTCKMNILDPTYVVLTLGGTNYQTAANRLPLLSKMYTNLLFDINLTLTYSTAVDLSLDIVRTGTSSAYTSYKTVYETGASIPASPFLHFGGLFQKSDETTIKASSSSTDAEVFAAGKAYYETAGVGYSSNKTFLSTDGVTSLVAASRSLTAPASQTTATFDLFLNVDYDDAKTYAYFYGTRLGSQYSLYTDYYFLIKARQVS